MSFIPWPIHGCQKRTSNYMSYGAHQGEILDIVNGYVVIRCQTCIAIHVANMPTEEFLHDYYCNHFYNESKPDYIQRYEEDRAWHEMHHQYTVNQALMLLNKSTAHACESRWGRDLYTLDIGSGPGIYLDVAQRSGLKTYGIEPNPNLCEASILNGHIMYTGILEKTNPFGDQKFDLINAWETAEHVIDQDLFFERCYNMLNTGGVLHVVVPNEYTEAQLLACKMYHLPRWWVAPFEHLWYGQPKDLQLSIRRIGTFKIVDIRGTFPLIEHFIIDCGVVYVGDEKLGRECHHERVEFEMYKLRHGKFEDLMEEYRDNVSTPYSGSSGREFHVLAVKE